MRERARPNQLSESGPGPVARTGLAPAGVTSDWRRRLPRLDGTLVTLRGLESEDAIPLFAMLSTEEVGRFISPPPTTLDGFRRFISWAGAEQLAGRHLCFAVVARDLNAAVGLFQVRALEPTFDTAEWGFAFGSPYWGSGMFLDAARLVVAFIIESLGVHRLEARAAMVNGRGNAALRKLGAVQEGVLRRSLLRGGRYLDQILWTILADEWPGARELSGSSSDRHHRS